MVSREPNTALDKIHFVSTVAIEISEIQFAGLTR